MGCIVSKREKPSVADGVTQTEHIKDTFYYLFNKNKKTDKIVDYYDFPYKGDDVIF